MMIKVLHTYSGRLTNKQKIFADIYAENDPALFGIADYLVENGHALRLDIPFSTNIPTQAITLNNDSPLLAPKESPTDNVETPIVSEPLAVDDDSTEEIEIEDELKPLVKPSKSKK